MGWNLWACRGHIECPNAIRLDIDKCNGRSYFDGVVSGGAIKHDSKTSCTRLRGILLVQRGHLLLCCVSWCAGY